MERDYGYVKVRMGPLFPSKRNIPPTDHYPGLETQPPHYRDSRFLEPDHNRRNTPHDHDEKRYVWDGSNDVSKPRYVHERHHQVNHERPVKSPSPRNSQLYPESPPGRSHRRESFPAPSRNHEIRHPERKPVQRSTSFVRPTSLYQDPRKQNNNSHIEPYPPHRSPSKPRESARPTIPHPDYRSRSVDPQYRPNPERGRNEEPRQEYRKKDHYNPDHSKRKESNPRNIDVKLQKPHIPKPDYTWHRKKKPSYDQDYY